MSKNYPIIFLLFSHFSSSFLIRYDASDAYLLPHHIQSTYSLSSLNKRSNPNKLVDKYNRPTNRLDELFFATPRNDNVFKDDGKDLTNEEISRYSRHLVLGDVGMAGQRVFKNSSVLVIGAGGLGSPCLMYLAAAGVGHIGIVDADTVDESNLQRQIIHGTSTVNKSKCQSSLERIQDINPNVNVRLYEEEFTSKSALRILSEGFSPKQKWDVVVDGSDNFPTKYLINDACDICDISWVYSAILAFEGQASVFNFPPGIGPTYRDMVPTPPPPGDVPSCAEGGVLGVLPGTMGCIQATEVLKILLGKLNVQANHNDKKMGGEVLTGKVLVYNALAMTFETVGLKRLPQQERQEITELIDYVGFCAGPKVEKETNIPSSIEKSENGGRTMDEVEDPIVQSTDAFHTIDPKEALRKLSGGWSPYVLDVRLQTEHDIVSLPFTDAVVPHRTVGPHNIPKNDDIEVLVYCKGGVRGVKACTLLVEHGVDPDRLYNLNGGIMKWRKDVDASMPKY